MLLLELPLGNGAFDRLALGAIPAVPLARDLAGQFAVAEAERQRQTEGDGAEQDGEGRGDDVGGDAQLLQRHEDREHDHAEPAHAGQRRGPLHRPGRGHDQSAGEPAQHDPRDHDDDRRHQARQIPDQFGEHARQRLHAERRRRDHDDAEHQDPEQRLADDARRIEVGAAALHRLHHATPFQRLVQPDAVEKALGALLDQFRQEVSGEQNDQGAEHRRDDFGELGERLAQSFEEGHWGGRSGSEARGKVPGGDDAGEQESGRGRAPAPAPDPASGLRRVAWGLSGPRARTRPSTWT